MATTFGLIGFKLIDNKLEIFNVLNFTNAKEYDVYINNKKYQFDIEPYTKKLFDIENNNFDNEFILIEVKKGDVIGQVIFMKYLLTDDDKATGTRVGGFGSTDKIK